MAKGFEIWHVYFQDATLAVIILVFLSFMLRYVFKVKRFRLRRHGSEFNLQFTNSDNSQHSETVELSPTPSVTGEEVIQNPTSNDLVAEVIKTIRRERRASLSNSTHSAPENINLPSTKEGSPTIELV